MILSKIHLCGVRGKEMMGVHTHTHAHACTHACTRTHTYVDDVSIFVDHDVSVMSVLDLEDVTDQGI